MLGMIICLLKFCINKGINESYELFIPVLVLTGHQGGTDYISAVPKHLKGHKKY